MHHGGHLGHPLQHFRTPPLLSGWPGAPPKRPPPAVHHQGRLQVVRDLRALSSQASRTQERAERQHHGGGHGTLQVHGTSALEQAVMEVWGDPKTETPRRGRSASCRRLMNQTSRLELKGPLKYMQGHFFKSLSLC